MSNLLAEGEVIADLPGVPEEVFAVELACETHGAAADLYSVPGEAVPVDDGLNERVVRGLSGAQHRHRQQTLRVQVGDVQLRADREGGRRAGDVVREPQRVVDEVRVLQSRVAPGVDDPRRFGVADLQPAVGAVARRPRGARGEKAARLDLL